MENPLITREQLKVEIDLVQEQHLETLYQLIKALQRPQDQQPTGLVSRLKAIQIPASSDFAHPIEVLMLIRKTVMSKIISFNDLLEAVEHLPLDEQESLIEVIRHRIADHRRQEISTLILSAREEYKAGKLVPETPQDIMKSVLS